MLSKDDAAIIKGLLGRGEKQHDIASFFGVNAGRIAEVATGAKFPEVEAAANKDLPTTGDMVSGFSIHFARQALIRAKLGIQMALDYLADWEISRAAPPTPPSKKRR